MYNNKHMAKLNFINWFNDGPSEFNLSIPNQGAKIWEVFEKQGKIGQEKIDFWIAVADNKGTCKHILTVWGTGLPISSEEQGHVHIEGFNITQTKLHYWNSKYRIKCPYIAKHYDYCEKCYFGKWTKYCNNLNYTASSDNLCIEYYIKYNHFPKWYNKFIY